jgi:type IV secretory pathway VirB10-like protein
MWESRPAVAPEPPEVVAPEPEPEPVAPPEPEFVELVVPADAVIGLQLETTVSSDRARVEDAVDARVTRDVRVSGRVAIPAGALVHGTVTEVERGGKMRERARLAIRFHTVVLASGDKLTLRTDAITREGDAPGRESAAKIGGAAIGGAILGAILGGGKGAAIGAGVGAGGGTAAVMAGDPSRVTIPAGSTVSVRMRQPVAVTVEKE